MSGSFGTFLADIGGIFVNELIKHFTNNLLFSFVFLRSIWLTPEEFLYSLSFCFTFLLVQKAFFLSVLAHFQHILEFFFWISCQIDLGVIYSSPSPCFCDCYPFCWLFFGFKQWDFRQFWHISSASLEVFFRMTCQINLTVIYPYSLRLSWSIWPTGGQILRSHPFLWLFSWFKKWHFRQFWHISSTFWRFFSEWVSKSF